MSQDSIKILIADDHEMIIEGMKLMLNQVPDFEVVAEAYDGEKVIEIVKSIHELDLVILDINMPKKDGIEVAKQLKEEFPEVKILIVSMYNRPEFIKNLIAIGVDGYVLKNSGKKELHQAIRSLMQNEPFYGKEITKTVIKSYQKKKVFDSPLDIEVTEREKDVIRLIADGLNSAEIAEKLFVSSHTIDTHRKNILSKLQVKNSAGVIRFGIQTGIVKGFDLF
ncbi:MAG: response regulator transcription factor [Roseivirga sp.]|nr:response regulator transcription factor [Roseivirga sp.]